MFINNLAGGLTYHLRAVRYRTSLWVPFRAEVSRWLNSWPVEPEGQELLLIGPSGGHCLDVKWLSRWKRIFIVEPDPVAKRILEFRIKGPKLSWVPVPGFTLPEYRTLFSEIRGASVLFSNVLGQVSVLDHGDQEPSEEFLRFQQELYESCLLGRKCASFHDRLSGRVNPSQMKAIDTAARFSNEEIVHHFCDEFGGGELLDHDLEAFFPMRLSASTVPWEITPDYFHFIEFCCEA